MRTAVWQGFDHFWENDPHRVNLFASYISAQPDASQPGPTVAYHSRMSIGRFPADTCHTYALVQELGTPTMGFLDGEVALDVGGTVGEGVEKRAAAVTHTLPGHNLTATVVLRGFSLETANFRHGFHTRGFGFLADRIQQQNTQDGTRISFVPVFFMFPDRSPDPSTDPDRLFWRVMPFPDWMEPKSPTEFEYRMTLYYRIVYAASGDLAVRPVDIVRTAKSHDYPVRYPGPDSRVTVEGVPGGEFGAAALGLRGFRFELCRWPRTRYQGRYLRKLMMSIDAMDYDPETGRAAFDPKMLFTNYGVRGGRRTTGERRRWLAFLTRRPLPHSDRVRALMRLLLGSYGFEAQYTLHPTLIQLRGGEAGMQQRMHNVVRSRGPGTKAVHSLLSAVRRRTRWRGAARGKPFRHTQKERERGEETLPEL